MDLVKFAIQAPEMQRISRIHFVGIGGVGMGGILAYCKPSKN